MKQRETSPHDVCLEELDVFNCHVLPVVSWEERKEIVAQLHLLNFKVEVCPFLVHPFDWKVLSILYVALDWCIEVIRIKVGVDVPKLEIDLD